MCLKQRTRFIVLMFGSNVEIKEGEDMKEENNEKIIWCMPIGASIGIVLGIVIAACLHESIGIGISLGWSIGFFVGAVIANILYRIKKRKSKYDKRC